MLYIYFVGIEYAQTQTKVATTKPDNAKSKICGLVVIHNIYEKGDATL